MERLQPLSDYPLLKSSLCQSEPVDCPPGSPWFVNAVVSLATELSAKDLLTVLQTTERHFGRIRGEPNGPRILDLDILDYQGEVMNATSLVLPHPRLHERRFVLMPIAEIAPDWRHPILGLTAAQLLARLYSEQQIEHLSC